MIVSEQMKSNEIMQLGYSACLDGVGIPNSGLTVESCGETWFQSRGGVGWEEWFQAVGALALAAVIIYGIVWLAAWVVKWILQGRNQAS